MSKIHTFELELNWGLVADLRQIDRFDAYWGSTEKREGMSLKQLRSIATVRSVGASTRIEGSKMNDEEVDLLLQQLDKSKLEERDKQEVAGYYEVLELIITEFDQINISESSIKELHSRLLQQSDKDGWHKGEYKQLSNSVEATLPDGTKQLVFHTTPPGIETEDHMRALFSWYAEDEETHPLVKSALFTYEFLSIHPFQDGNGRLSRLLSTLLLLKNGYKWIQYISFEHEIENRKTEYYRVLRSCQSQRPNEDVSLWMRFFLDAMSSVQKLLEQKLAQTGAMSQLTPKERSILSFVSEHAGSSSGMISKKLGIPAPTVKRLLSELAKKDLLERAGIGPGTHYTAK